MNKRVFVKEIREPDREVKDFFVVVAKHVSTTRENKRFMTIVLRDRTGTIEGKIWDEEEVERASTHFETGEIVHVDSRSSIFQGKPQLKVKRVSKANGDVTPGDLANFYGISSKTTEQLKADYDELVAGMKNPYLAGLFSVIGSHGETMEKFFSYPASVGVHHIYIGGLLDHSLNVARMSEQAAGLLGGDIDLVRAGSLLHDIGKTEEIHFKGGFSYSDKGRLLGHITLGVMLLDDWVREVKGFPRELAELLTHIIISHHGSEEWGSPRKPMCVEALIVHYIDNLDAKVTGVKEHMAENMEDTRWTEYHRLYGSRFYKVPER